MQQIAKLNFPENYQIRLKQSEDTTYIFCIVRKIWLIYTPEEWVRQNVLFFLTKTLGYSLSNIGLEVSVNQLEMRKRADIVVYKLAEPYIIVECKRPSVKITQNVFDQLARYNLKINSKFLMVTNGIDHYYCTINYKEKVYQFLKELPINKK